MNHVNEDELISENVTFYFSISIFFLNFSGTIFGLLYGK